MKCVSFIIAFTLLLSCSVDDETIILKKSAETVDEFKEKLTGAMNYPSIIATFGAPARDIGSGVHIYVYPLADNTEVWIGYDDRILYVYHMSAQGELVEQLFIWNWCGTP